MRVSVYPYSVTTDIENSKPKTSAKFWFKPHVEPIHAKWYAFASQTSIGVSWFAGITSYVIYKTGACTLLGH